MNKKQFAVATILVACLSASAFAQTDSKTQYARMCVLCHGADGKAETSMGKTVKAADLTSKAIQSQSDAELANVISHGKGKMAAYEGILGKQGVESMVKYIRATFGPKK